tara:strand:+ start:1244 stop:1912 length:669 start_codon:yes stop_codon:yes gene_type:complete
MTYNELIENIQDITEQTFTTAQLNLFITQTENKVFAVADSGDVVKESSIALSSGSDTVILPTDLLYILDVSLTDPSSKTTKLLQKDASFLREAFPYTGGDSEVDSNIPQYYALGPSGTTIEVQPINASLGLQVLVRYVGEPTSLTSGTIDPASGETLLAGKFPNVLLNGCLVEAARFMKAEQDIIANYDNMFQQSLTEYKVRVEGKQRRDEYRDGQIRVPVA